MKTTTQIIQAVLILTLPTIMLTACGIKRPLLHPNEIPAYEKKLEKKRLEREEFLREQEELRQRQLQQLDTQNGQEKTAPTSNNAS